MSEIKCPKCGTSFTIDEKSYADILKQVHDEEYEKDLKARLQVVAAKHRSELELARSQTRNELTQSLMQKDKEIANLSSRAKDKINALKVELERSESENKLAVKEAVTRLEKECDKLRANLELADAKAKNTLSSLKERYELQLKDKDDQIASYKDFRLKGSTKMLGEDLEQYCEMEFNKLRPYAFPRAYFEKDNTLSKESRSKGDFIFRDYDADGNEILSIMFEMKNENAGTAQKRKNKDFFKELDKDRREKKCEYAILVSMLEADSELYNTGIVDVSTAQNGFEKMFVIRPQFFIAMIGILRNAALNAAKYRKELALIKNQNIDVSDFEERITRWKESFELNSQRATKNFEKAILDLEKSISFLTKTRDELLKVNKNFQAANNKLDDLSIKKLSRGNATMSKMFKDLEQK